MDRTGKLNLRVGPICAKTLTGRQPERTDGRRMAGALRTSERKTHNALQQCFSTFIFSLMPH